MAVSPNCSATSPASRTTSGSRARRSVSSVDGQDGGGARSTRPSRPSRIPSRRLTVMRRQRRNRATSGSSAPASTARRAANRATLGNCPCAVRSSASPRIRGDERLDREPDQRRQVLIRGILGARQQTIGDGPACSAIEPLQRRRKIETNDRRAIVASHAREASRRLARACRSSVSNWIAQRAHCTRRDRTGRGKRLRRPAAGHVQRPHRAQPHIRIRIRVEDAPQLGVRADCRACRARHGPAGSRARAARASRSRSSAARRARCRSSAAGRRIGPATSRRERRRRRDAKDPAGLMIQHVGAADVRIVPVEHVERRRPVRPRG